MNLSSFNLVEIVNDLKEVTKYDINFISIDGIILYSTNSERIGNRHLIGKQVCVSGQTIEVGDIDLVGVMPGINSPIVVNDNIIGCIGVTGEPDTVREYQHITKKFTERYIQAQLYLQDSMSTKNLNRSIINAVIKKNSLIAFHSDLIAKDLVEDQKFQILLVAKLETYQIENIMKQIQSVIICTNIDGILCIIINKLKLDSTLLLFDSIDCNIALGPVVDNYNELYYSYDSARVLLKMKRKKIAYDELDIDIALAYELEYNHKYYNKNIIDRLILNVGILQMEDLLKVYICYIENNKSIKLCAEKLYLSNSTVKYKINKLYDSLNIEYQTELSILLYIAAKTYFLKDDL